MSSTLSGGFQYDLLPHAGLRNEHELVFCLYRLVAVLFGGVGEEKHAQAVAPRYFQILGVASLKIRAVGIDHKVRLRAFFQIHLREAQRLLGRIVHHEGVGACGLSADDGVEVHRVGGEP